MTPDDHLAYRMYCDYINLRGLTPLEWDDLLDTERHFWHSYAELMVARFNLEQPPRRTARTVVVKREGRAA